MTKELLTKAGEGGRRRSLFTELLSCYRGYEGTAALIVCGSLLAAGLELFFPWGLRYIMERLMPTGDMTALIEASALMLALYALSYLVDWGTFYVGRTMGASIENDLRTRLFSRLLWARVAYFDRTNTGQLLSRLVSDISEIGQLMFSLPNRLIACLITMAGTIVLLFFINVKLALIVSVLLIVKAIQAVYTNRAMKLSFKKTREETGDVTAIASESLQAIRLVKAFGGEDAEVGRLASAGGRLVAAQKKSFRLVGRMNTGLVFFSNATTLAIIVLGSLFIAAGEMTAADLVAFLLYMVVFMRPIFQLTVLTETYQKGMAGFRRYLELMAAADGEERGDTSIMPEGVGIEFADVDFSYLDGTPILRGLSANIKEGETVAIVGPTGAGKSTICRLLLRFYEPQAGRISLGGKNLSELSPLVLRRLIGWVQQEVFLFSDTVRANIAYGSQSASFEDIVRAAKLARAHDFIMALPHGYDSEVGERGVKLSGGQKQRLAIARVFLKNPRLLLLDEATSSLDNETEQEVRLAMRALAENRTTVIVAHRLASIQDADRIIVLDGGRVAEEGRHDELLERRGVYWRLYQAQFREESAEEK